MRDDDDALMSSIFSPLRQKKSAARPVGNDCSQKEGRRNQISIKEMEREKEEMEMKEKRI